LEITKWESEIMAKKGKDKEDEVKEKEPVLTTLG
jgi:hypothetical protein